MSRGVRSSIGGQTVGQRIGMSRAAGKGKEHSAGMTCRSPLPEPPTHTDNITLSSRSPICLRHPPTHRRILRSCRRVRGGGGSSSSAAA